MHAQDETTHTTFRAPLTLALLAPMLTELLSGSQNPVHFFFPPVLVMLLLIYGVPVLLIREFWIRIGAGLPALFALGLAYGIFNEGVVAKTLLLGKGVPLGVFDRPVVLGINWAWAALIVPWHAIQAVLLPITLVEGLYRGTTKIRWLPDKALPLGALLSLVVGVITFFKMGNLKASPLYLWLFLFLIAVLTLIAAHLPGRAAKTEDGRQPKARDILAGISFYPAFVLSLCFLAAVHALTAVIVFASIIWAFVLLRILNGIAQSPRRRLAFCLSLCLSSAATTGIGMLFSAHIPGFLVDLLISLVSVRALVLAFRS